MMHSHHHLWLIIILSLGIAALIAGTAHKDANINIYNVNQYNPQPTPVRATSPTKSF